MAHITRGTKFAVLLALACGIAALFAYILYEPGMNEAGSPRDARIAEFRQEMQLGDGESLVWTPQLLSETFGVGTVFPAAGLGQAVTTACKAGDAMATNLSLKLGNGKRYEAKPEMSLGDSVKLDLEGAKALEYALSVEAVEVLPAYGDLIRNLASDPECLAMIANRDVTVLYGVYRGDEKYALSRTMAGNLSAGKFAELAGAKLGLSGTGTDNADFERSDVALMWSLTRVRLNDDRFPEGPGTEAFRLAKAQELLRQETDYSNRAEARAEVRPLDAGEIDSLLAAAEEMAAKR